jgi:hypothetical protein
MLAGSRSRASVAGEVAVLQDHGKALVAEVHQPNPLTCRNGRNALVAPLKGVSRPDRVVTASPGILPPICPLTASLRISAGIGIVMRSHIGLSSMRNAIGSAALAILVAGCAGGEDSAERGRTSPSSASPSPAVDEEAIAEAEADASECEAEMGDFLEALQALDSRLEKGGYVFRLDEYALELADIQAVYDRIDYSGLSQGCIHKVGVRSEKAFNAYVRTGNSWVRCFRNSRCDHESTRLRSGKSWLQASRLIRNAEYALEGLAEPA